MKIINIDPRHLIPTEKIISDNISVLIKNIGMNPINWPPIIVSEESYILDGHHRHDIALTHSFKTIPAYCLSYYDPRIQVFDYNDGTPLDKATLLKIYKSGLLLNPKTTRHIVETLI